jgi:hypothetical protein
LFLAEFYISTLRFRLTIEEVPEEFVADFYFRLWEILGHRRIQVCHYEVEVVHLPRVRNHRHRMRFCQGRDLASLRDAAYPIRVELNNAYRASSQLASAI